MFICLIHLPTLPATKSRTNQHYSTGHCTSIIIVIGQVRASPCPPSIIIVIINVEECSVLYTLRLSPATTFTFLPARDPTYLAIPPPHQSQLQENLVVVVVVMVIKPHVLPRTELFYGRGRARNRDQRRAQTKTPVHSLAIACRRCIFGFLRAVGRESDRRESAWTTTRRSVPWSRA